MLNRIWHIFTLTEEIPLSVPLNLFIFILNIFFTSSFLFNLWKMITLVVACRSSSLPRIYLNLVSQKCEVFGNLFILKVEVVKNVTGCGLGIMIFVKYQPTSPTGALCIYV